MASDTGPRHSDASTWSLTQTLLRVACAFIIGSVLALIVPKILGEEYATRKVARVVAPIVGAFYPREARTDDITVVLVDDQTLKEASETWPPSYDYYSGLLERIRRYRPRAVFIDLIFASERVDADPGELRNTLDELVHDHIDVYLAAALDEHGKLSVRKELDGPWKKVAVEYSPDELDRVVWAYPMTGFGRDEGEAHEKNTSHEAHGGTHEASERRPRSAALAIFEDSYHNRVEDAEAPLALTWGLAPVRDGLLWSVVSPESGRQAAGAEPGQADKLEDKSYEQYCQSGESTIGLLWRAIPHALVPERGKPVCVFHHTVYARELLYLNPTTDGRFLDAFNHKVVMIGGALANSNDIVFSPIHERVPGVYLHAMALDNLLSKGPDYTKAVELGFEFDDAHVRAFWLVLVGLLGVAIVSISKERLVESRKERRHVKHERAPTHNTPETVDETVTAARPEIARFESNGNPGALVLLDAASTQSAAQSTHPTSASSLQSVRAARRAHGTAKFRTALHWTCFKVCEIALSLAIVGALLYLGQAFFNVAYLTAVHVALFALVSEWLEWNKHLVDWLLAPEE